MKSLDFPLLLLMAVLLPWDWTLSLYPLALFFLNAVAKCVVARRLGNPALDKAGRWPHWALVALVAWYAVSLFWTTNLTEGISMVVTKSSVLLASLGFLMADTRHLDHSRLRWILYSFALSLVGLFLVRLGINIHRVITEPGTTFVSRLCFGFDKRHHAYISIYILMALWGIYLDQINGGKSSSPDARLSLLNIPLVLLLVSYLVFINSRAGVLFMLLSLFLMAGHAIYVRRRWVKPLLSLAVALVVAVGVHYALPKTQNRVNQTSLSEAAAARGTTEQASKKDKRIPIWQASLDLASRHWLMGVGVGDRFDSLKPIFARLGDQESIDRRKNCHCQPLDTLVSTGIVGLLLLVFFFVALFVASWRQRNWLLFVVALCLGFNCIFETLFDRQMALIFIPVAIALVQHYGRETSVVSQS